jgi:oligosaccharide translocation protein RFT1
MKANHTLVRWMAAFSAVFVVATGAFYRLGQQDVSLIYANIVNLVSRILFAAHFIGRYYRQQGEGGVFRRSSLLPTGAFGALVVLCGSVLRATAVVGMNDLKQGRRLDYFSLKAILQHFAGGVVLALVCGAVWWFQTGRKLVLPSR